MFFYVRFSPCMCLKKFLHTIFLLFFIKRKNTHIERKFRVSDPLCQKIYIYLLRPLQVPGTNLERAGREAQGQVKYLPLPSPKNTKKQGTQ